MILSSHMGQQPFAVNSTMAFPWAQVPNAAIKNTVTNIMRILQI